jgi:hypothetical protein
MTQRPPEQPTSFDAASDRLLDAMAACERGALLEALEAVRKARIILETEEQFRRARRAQA